MDRGFAFAALAVGCHVLLFVSVVAMLYRAVDVPPWRQVAISIGALPLLATLPGLLAGRRRAMLWLSLLLVVYSGAAVTEAVASRGTNRLASLAALLAVVEIGVLPILSRRRSSVLPEDRE